MNKYILILLLSFSQLTFGLTVVTGSMTCRIMSTDYIESKEGKTTKYTGITGGPVTGDYAKFSYSVNDISITYNFHSSDGTYLQSGSAGVLGVWDHTFKDTPPFLQKEGLFFTEDHISFTDEGRGARLSRYYKGDWSGIFHTPEGNGGILITTANCQNKNDKIDEIIKEVLSRPR